MTRCGKCVVCRCEVKDRRYARVPCQTTGEVGPVADAGTPAARKPLPQKSAPGTATTVVVRRLGKDKPQNVPPPCVWLGDIIEGCTTCGDPTLRNVHFCTHEDGPDKCVRGKTRNPAEVTSCQDCPLREVKSSAPADE